MHTNISLVYISPFLILKVKANILGLSTEKQVTVRHHANQGVKMLEEGERLGKKMPQAEHPWTLTT